MICVHVCAWVSAEWLVLTQLEVVIVGLCWLKLKEERKLTLGVAHMINSPHRSAHQPPFINKHKNQLVRSADHYSVT